MTYHLITLPLRVVSPLPYLSLFFLYLYHFARVCFLSFPLLFHFPTRLPPQF